MSGFALRVQPDGRLRTVVISDGDTVEVAARKLREIGIEEESVAALSRVSGVANVRQSSRAAHPLVRWRMGCANWFRVRSWVMGAYHPRTPLPSPRRSIRSRTPIAS
jgi:hypothetical protein